MEAEKLMRAAMYDAFGEAYAAIGVELAAPRAVAGARALRCRGGSRALLREVYAQPAPPEPVPPHASDGDRDDRAVVFVIVAVIGLLILFIVASLVTRGG